MGIFGRVSDILKANVNELIDKAEDPAKMMDQMIREMHESLREAKIEIPVTFFYQACDDKICYPPTRVPLRFVLDIEGHDVERSPGPLQRKKTSP